jgi:hypothetical protein
MALRIPSFLTPRPASRSAVPSVARPVSPIARTTARPSHIFTVGSSRIGGPFASPDYSRIGSGGDDSGRDDDNGGDGDEGDGSSSKGKLGDIAGIIGASALVFAACDGSEVTERDPAFYGNAGDGHTAAADAGSLSADSFSADAQTGEDLPSSEDIAGAAEVTPTVDAGPPSDASVVTDDTVFPDDPLLGATFCATANNTCRTDAAGQINAAVAEKIFLDMITFGNNTSKTYSPNDASDAAKGPITLKPEKNPADTGVTQPVFLGNSMDFAYVQGSKELLGSIQWKHTLPNGMEVLHTFTTGQAGFSAADPTTGCIYSYSTGACP